MNGVLLGIFLLVVVTYGQYDTGRGYNKKTKGNSKLPALVSGILGSVIGGFLQQRKLGKKYKAEKQELLNYIQMQEDIYKQRDNQWQAEYKKLYTAYEKLENETLERDYEEFSAPDTNKDEMISRQEFAIYVNKYLSNFPELSEEDFPKFDEFDLNHDGMVTFEEWQRFLKMQKAKEKAEAASATGGTGKKNNAAYQELLEALGGQLGANNQRRGQAQARRI